MNKKSLPALVYCVLCIACVSFVSPTFIVHEAHFYLSALIRTNYDLNVKVGEIVQGFMKFVDQYGTDDSSRSVDVARFHSLALTHDFAGLASLAVESVLFLHPPERHNAYILGIADSWSQWVSMMLICAVRGDCDSSDSSEALPFDLSEFNMRTTNAWRGLAGSDDVLWATLMAVEIPHLIDLHYRWNGARGALQLFTEVESHFLSQSLNVTEIFWDTNRDYVATIGISLWVAACAKLSRTTQDERYVRHAMGGVATLLHGDQPLISQAGNVFDGRYVANGAINTDEWSYNAGVAISAMTQLYLETGNERFFFIAERIVQTSMQTFWQTGHLGEHKAPLNRDQILFKGIMLHYISEFLQVFLEERRKIPQWLVGFQKRLEAESLWLVRERLFPEGICTHWGEIGANETCHAKERYTFAPQGLVCAARLFALTHQVRKMTGQSQ